MFKKQSFLQSAIVGGPETPEPATQESYATNAPFKMGDVVCLKSGGFSMTVVEAGYSRSCCDARGEWLIGVIYAPDRLDRYPGDFERGGFLQDEFEADLLMLAPSRDMDADVPF